MEMGHKGLLCMADNGPGRDSERQHNDERSMRL